LHACGKSGEGGRKCVYDMGAPLGAERETCQVEIEVPIVVLKWQHTWNTEVMEA